MINSKLVQDYLFEMNLEIFYLMKNLGGVKGLFSEKKLIEYTFKYCRLGNGLNYSSELEVKRILKDLINCNFLQTTKPKQETYYFFTKKSYERLFNTTFNQMLKNSYQSYVDWENKIKFLETNLKNIHNPDVQNSVDFMKTYYLNTLFDFTLEKQESILKALKVKDNKELFQKHIKSLNGMGYKVLNLNQKKGIWFLFPNYDNDSEFIKSIKNSLRGIDSINTLSFDETKQYRNILIIAIPEKYKTTWELNKYSIFTKYLQNDQVKTNEDIETMLSLQPCKITTWYY